MGCQCVENKCTSGCGENGGKPCKDKNDCKKNGIKNSYTIEEFKKLTSKKYQIKYINQKGGSKVDNKLNWSNKSSLEMYNSLTNKIGEPKKICKNSNNQVEYVVWQDDYDKVNFGRLGGLDFLKVTNYHARKWHPKPADVYIIAGKYMDVPDHLLGPIKYASETINVEQLFVDHKSNKHFGETGKKGKVLVTGSCASIDISTVTVAFVEDMIRKYKDLKEINLELHQKFKDEYDNRINNYIKTGKFNPISWYKRSLFYD